MENKISIKLTKEQIRDAISYIGCSDNASARELVEILENRIKAERESYKVYGSVSNNMYLLGTIESEGNAYSFANAMERSYNNVHVVKVTSTITLRVKDASIIVAYIVNSFDDISASPEFAEAFYRLKDSLEA